MEEVQALIQAIKENSIPCGMYINTVMRVATNRGVNIPDAKALVKNEIERHTDWKFS